MTLAERKTDIEARGTALLAESNDYAQKLAAVREKLLQVDGEYRLIVQLIAEQTESEKVTTDGQ